MGDPDHDRERRQIIGLLMQTTSFAEGQLDYTESFLRRCAEGHPPDPRFAAKELRDFEKLREVLEIFKRQLAPLLPPAPFSQRWLDADEP